MRRTLTFGDRTVVESPSAPSLPAFVTGQHLIALEILQDLPGDPVFPFQFPVARYFVEDRGARGLGAAGLGVGGWRGGPPRRPTGRGAARPGAAHAHMGRRAGGGAVPGGDL